MTAVGWRAVLVDPQAVGVAEPAEAASLLRRWGGSWPAGLGRMVDVVVGRMSVLVVFDREVDRARIAEAIGRPAAVAPDDFDPGERSAGTGAGANRPPIVIPVRYDGDDLHSVADACGLSTDEVIRRHQAATYRVAFLGFTAGFAYLDGLDPLLGIARRSTPRTRVPAGSVAIADGQCAVYPRSTPGGWHLLGTTSFAVWDEAADPPAVMEPGRLVQFRDDRRAAPTWSGERRAALSAATSGATPDRGAHAGSVDGGRALVVHTPGFGATVQDAGRPGWAHLGVSASGALDPDAWRLGNRLVGNPALPDGRGAASIEVLLGGFECTATAPVWVAVTGADGPVHIDGAPAAHGVPLALRPGQRLRVGVATDGLRRFVAVSGGVDVPTVLGSRSTDTLSGLGPEPLAAGTVLAVGPISTDPPGLFPGPAPVTGSGRDRSGQPGEPLAVRVALGPDDEHVANTAALFDNVWRIGADTSRVGVRLDGDATLAWATDGEQPSSGMAAGAIQVPRDGRPIVFLADHPTTGGYPVIGVVHPSDLAGLAQRRPGAAVRFVVVTRKR
ncbi:MAG TPA: urea amidolyase family protein [Microthrixaceae bacterium]|nr:urea amidolyase family protein [Microthrixaceae bacterium]HMT24638.1 urea amidolyase family protein [Microthrixaceae bacterium]HMT61530.1 urea amidolyase family protein [Microthrixaceae bacterium]